MRALEEELAKGSGQDRKATRLSGPHICTGVGNQVTQVIRDSLLCAAEVKGGSLTADEMSSVIDSVTASENLFKIYQANYNQCGKIHERRKFVVMDKNFFSVFVMRVLCSKTIHHTFEDQIKRSDKFWEVHFARAQTDYFDSEIDQTFKDQLYSRYQALTRVHMSELSPKQIIQDADLIGIVRATIIRMKKQSGFADPLSNIINQVLSKTYHAFGPSPVKVSEPLIEKYITALQADALQDPKPHNTIFGRRSSI